jgi:ketosteroid isomerase-like protein
MTSDNVETVRRGYEALNEGGIEAALDFFDPDVEIDFPPEISPEPQTLRGHEAIRRWFEVLAEIMESVRIEPEEFIEAGNRVVVPVRLIGTGRGSGIEAVQRVTQVWTLRDGRAVRMDAYAEKASALEVVGLPADA